MKTTEKIITEFKQINNKYDYSLVKYVNCRVKVKVICPIHGVFEMTPSHLLKGVGCPKCVGMYKTTTDVINEFKNIHGDIYDYSLVEYINAKTKVKIICPIHGLFEQSTNSHLQGHGCSKCSSDKLSKLYSLGKDKFIEKSNKIHNNKYDYSLVEYINSNKKVKIICPIHGEFKQTPGSHILGRGCCKCGKINLWIKRKITNEQFIKKCKEVHKNKYDYSLVEYINAHTKVKIICPIHGIFEQYANSHSSGRGCFLCQGTYSNTNKFILKSKETHNDKYDYSLVEYINGHTKVKIICKEHGIFEQNTYSHINGAGCPTCSNNNIFIRSQKQSLGIGNFIMRSNNIHNNKYDYSLVEYINCKTKVKIICKEHGIFEQLPDHHHRGVGCPTCSGFYGVKFSERYLYIFYDEKYNLMKIGASNNPEKRLKEISKGKDRNGLILLKKYETSALMENKLHKEYEQYRTIHTLYKDGSTEWFKLDKNEINNIDIFIRKNN